MATDYLAAIGVGAGFDTKKIVTALVDAEKAGKQSNIDRRTTEVDASVSGIAKLKSSLVTLQTAFEKVDDQNDFNFSSLANSAPTSVMAGFDSSNTLPGTYKVSVSQLAQNDVYQSNSVLDVLEVDTYTLSAAVSSSSGSASFTYGGVTYTKAFDTDAATTMAGLVAAINAGSAGSTVTAAATNSTVFTLTKDAGSDTQMTKGTIAGTTDGSTTLSISIADTTAGVGAATVDQNGTSAATVVIRVGSGAAETVTLAAGSTSLTNLVTGINALTADVSARIVETSDGSYRIVVEGPQGSDNALTITDSVFGLQTTNVPEVDTYTLSAGVATNGSAVFTYNGTTYTQAFDTSDVVTLTALTAQITAADPSVTAANGTSGTVFTITSNVGSDNQMTKGTIGGTSNGSAPLTILTADTTNGSDGNKIQSAQNALLSINGLSISSSSNQVSAAVPGLELSLMEITSTPVVLSLTRDTSLAKQAITDIVTAFNAFETVMSELVASGTSTSDPGSLKGDSSIRAIRDQVRSIFLADSSTPGSTKKGLDDIGISLALDGSFKVDSTALTAALSSSYSDITSMFSANTDNQTYFGTANRGISGDIVKQISTYLGFEGTVKLREGSYATTKATLAIEQTALDARTASAETRYTKQFSTMSRIMDEMKSTQDYLESSLGNLPFTANND
jgi:flagellar hook-associated protein 2